MKYVFIVDSQVDSIKLSSTRQSHVELRINTIRLMDCSTGPHMLPKVIHMAKYTEYAEFSIASEYDQFHTVELWTNLKLIGQFSCHIH